MMDKHTLLNLRPEYEAARLLSEQSSIDSGVWVKELRFERRIIFDTFENYRRICASEEAVPCEGCTVFAEGVFIVLYSHGWDIPRINYTLAHEVGHILLDHKGEAGDEEEANRFASALTVPFGPLRALGKVGARKVADFFGCSLSSAGCALRRANVVTPYDRKVTELFASRLSAFKVRRNPLDISYDL